MKSSEICCLLAGKIRRRGIAFRILWIVSAGCSGAALLVQSRWPWAITAILVCFLFILAWANMRKKYLSAWKVSENPQLVYWAHSHALPPRLARYGMKDYKVLTIHLRDGQQCEFNLPSDDVRKFNDWLSKQNPSVRWGAYDDIGIMKKSE